MKCFLYAGVCSMDKKLYVIGGWNGQRGITRCDIFDTELGQWSNMAPLSTGNISVLLQWYQFMLNTLLCNVDAYIFTML